MTQKFSDRAFSLRNGKEGVHAYLAAAASFKSAFFFQEEYYGSGKFGMCLNMLPVHIMDSITTQHFADFG